MNGPRCRCGRTGRARTTHTVFECNELEAVNAGSVAYARFVLKCADEGRNVTTNREFYERIARGEGTIVHNGRDLG